MTMIPDRRSVLVTGAAVLGAVALPRASAAAVEGLGPAGGLLEKCAHSCRVWSPTSARPRRLPGTARVARLELFRRDGLRQTGPAARADERGAKRITPGRIDAGVFASWDRQGAERDAAGHPGGERQRRRPAFVGALLARGVRHAGRDRHVGLPLRGPSSDPVGRGARQSHRVGHAVVVLGNSQPCQIGAAHRPQHAQGRRRPGAAADGRSDAEIAGQGADRRFDAL